MNKFRLLKAEEIEVKTSDDKALLGMGYVQLMLYKDARCDMNILDETVGPENWKKSYTRNNANCILSIWDEAKKEWIDKEDCGSASGNFDRDKSLASDSFKRAAVAWGIGRELYTGPKIYFPTKLAKNVTEERCADKFDVTEIVYDDRKIKSVTIRDITSGAVLFYDNTSAKILKNRSDAPPVSVQNAAPKQEPPKAPDTGKVDLENNLPFK